MKIKICGFTQAKNAKEASLLGIDAIGLVFYEKSSRKVCIEEAVKIIKCLPPFVNRVGLFVNASPGFIDSILLKVPLDTLQFHGDESATECAQYNMPFIKAIRVDNYTNIKVQADKYYKANGLLLDTFSKNSYGGTGKSFDWSLAKIKIDLPIILAGGINHKTVARAVKEVNPYAIDVSTGVESSNGIKDIDKIRQLIKKIK